MLSRTLRIIGSGFLLVALMGVPASAAASRNAAATTAAATDASFGWPDDSLAHRPPATATAVRKVGLGVSMLPDNDLSTYLSYKEQVGQHPASWSIWSNWGDSSGKFPTGDLMQQLRADHTVPLIFWQPVGPDSAWTGKYSRYNLIAGYTDGTQTYKPKYDAYIKQFARDAKAYGDVVLLRFAHEMDGSWFPWGMKRFDNTPTNFVKAWRHIWKLFQKVGATNVRFYWSPLSPSPKQHLYPGDKYVSYVGFTAFNWDDAGRPWISMIDSMRGRVGRLARITRKPVIVAEMGSAPGDGSGTAHDKELWIRDGYAAVYAQLPNVKGLIYFNIDMRALANQPDWSVTPAGSQGFLAYRDVVNQSRFKGKFR